MTTAQQYLDRRWTALILLCVAQFIVVLDASIVNVALPSIGKGLHFSEQDLPWVVNAYVIAFGGFLLLGGRAAEELFLNTMTTGAGNDIERSTDLARKMVCEFGMSNLGPLTFGKKEEQIFLGREIAQHRDFSEDTAEKIDAEVRRFCDEAYQSAVKILSSNRDKLEKVAQALLEREVIDANEIQMIIEGKELPARVNPNAPSTKDEVQQVLKPAPGQGNVAPGERPAQA